ncbi:hypothetical protein [Cryobacterium sp. Y11]|uniref:DUF7715 family protein n=1 Tax=Cryobacterium sp. Y11 TaxID=2045016 RepID=UPI000CE3C3C9|nr:hypothetical protein [Cryobacterium sp. Y11]
MHVLVATNATQGARRSDFANCIEGELVWMLDACPDSRRRPDGKCPCGRSFRGLMSDRGTTTALVKDLPELTRADYENAMEASFDARGWCPCCCMSTVSEFVDELISCAEFWPVGTVIERRVDLLQGRGPCRPYGAAR